MTDITTYLPEPTPEAPLLQLEYLFQRVIEAVGDATWKRSVLKTGLRAYKLWLDASGVGKAPFRVRERWSELSLSAYQRWLEQETPGSKEGALKLKQVRNCVAGVKYAMDWAYEHRVLDKPVHALPVSDTGRQTKIRAAYSDSELDALLDGLRSDVAVARRVLEPYCPLGTAKAPAGAAPAVWTSDNLVWYFEQVLGGVPLDDSATKAHAPFYARVCALYGGVARFYREAVRYPLYVDVQLIAPLAMQLAAETGLNVEALLALTVDSFVESDSLTGLPYLRYFKQRSKGEAQYPVSLLDTEGERLGLEGQQSQIVKKTIDLVLALSARYRDTASADIRDRLFLMQYADSKPNSAYAPGRAVALSHPALSKWCSERFLPGIENRDKNNSAHWVNASRFRPTKVTQLVRKGYDVMAISALMGHAQVSTTLSYLDKNEITDDFNTEMAKQLDAIRVNAQKFKGIPINVQSAPAPAGGAPFRTAGLTLCRNPYEPPSRVQHAKGYVPGKPCTYYDICLTCENVVLTEHSLPKLINYRLQLQQELEKGLSNEPRKGLLYRRTLAVLTQVLAPDELFTSEDLINAEALAKAQLGEVLDDFLYD